MGYSIWGSTYGKRTQKNGKAKFEYNAQYLEPPLPLNELILSSNFRKRLRLLLYRCVDLCPLQQDPAKRKLGIATAASGADCFLKYNRHRLSGLWTLTGSL